MEDGIFPANAMLGAPPDSLMDLDYMDELLLEGCWLETKDGSEFFPSTPPFDSSTFWPTLLAENSQTSTSSSQNNHTQEEKQKSSYSQNLSVCRLQEHNSVDIQSSFQDMINVSGYSNGSSDYTVEGPELSRRKPGPASSVMEKLIRALGHLRDSTRANNVLIQIWVPVNNGGRCVLTTSGQPFSLDLNCPSLASYRNISVNYQFPTTTEEDSGEKVGLPGRVFTNKVPEWTPDVQFFRSDEYLRVGHAQQCDVRGTLAVPVFEKGSRNCLGVVEVVLTTQKIKYRSELESICEALEAVDLRSSKVSVPQNVKACYASYQAALPEILDVFRSACGTHQLPLAQTWIPCIQQGKGGCRHSDENYAYCVSTLDSACHVADPRFQDFHEACSEHHLLKGQGVVGRAFTTNQPCFSSDITSFSKTEYPLSHHARMFGLHAAVAIRLRDIYTGTDDFVLEFFLPVDCKNFEDQKKMLTLLSIIIQKICRNLRVIKDEELEGRTFPPLNEGRHMSDLKPPTKQIPNLQSTYLERSSEEVSSWAAHQREARDSRTVNPISQYEEFKELLTEKSSETRQWTCPRDSSLTSSIPLDGECSIGFPSFGKTGERRRTKADNTITLQILRQYFAGSLKDAAKSLGVCPTTLKRICRQHGIKRWPSRKIKKVGHSLQKLQLVIDSVHGTSGALQLESFYSNFPDLASPNLSGGTGITSAGSKHDDGGQARPPGKLLESDTLSPQAVASKTISSSCSQSSCSSPSCSSEMRRGPSTLNSVDSEYPVVDESSGNNCVLKRARSDVELQATGLGPNLLPRSQSHMSLNEHLKSETHHPLPVNSGEKSQEDDRLRVKVTYGEEKIRFRIQSDWGYKELFREVGRRFCIDDSRGFHLKYLDDDSEWVLLTCNADWKECIDVCQSFGSRTIKLSLLRIAQQ